MRKDPLVELARRAIEAFVRERRVLEPPKQVPPELSRRAGVFVSLKKDGMLRGCIGTYLPTKENLAAEIIANAIKAATEDPRFPPVRPEELPRLQVSVDVLSPPEPCTEADLDPKRYGVIVEKGWRLGLLLPDLEGVDTVEEQLRIAKMKAGIAPDEPCKIYRFTVERHVE
ncbi:AmmeMemoRadiSam system protein A [Candidatus Bipolaricaulota bacterium]|nr:AmmeMemoRadiSam system protein A [Candidatus Bipolaricaulota bacterium]RLE28462.1 MAG: AMMECR1 domain-containing protein [Candidatus Acetothermia bacterium]RLE33569.1 MAG: AMMECR1 domain-containing protein [Candidatus Acetothermia bacterium]